MFMGFVLSPQSPLSAEEFAKMVDHLQNLLPETGFIVREWSIADAAAIAIFNIVELVLKNNLTKNKSEEPPQQFLELYTSPKFTRLWKYIDDNKARPSFQASWDEVRD